MWKRCQIHVSGSSFSRKSSYESSIFRYMQFLKPVFEVLKGSLALAIDPWCDNYHVFHGNGCYFSSDHNNNKKKTQNTTTTTKTVVLLSRDTTESVWYMWTNWFLTDFRNGLLSEIRIITSIKISEDKFLLSVNPRFEHKEWQTAFHLPIDILVIIPLSKNHRHKSICTDVLYK